jgi:hypothetical protein
MVNLNTLIPPYSDLELVEAAAINHRGEIVGNGVPPGCGDVSTCGHAYLLIPCNGDADEQDCEDEIATVGMGDTQTPKIALPESVRKLPSVDSGP